MNVRSQISMVFNLDKCIGCHTCSISCKNIWTDRKGAEYMWWNNVETRPGVGYPRNWEDQPVAEAFSQVSGERIGEIKGGPNWDDDLSGSQLYAAQDVNLEEKKIIED